MKTLEYWQNKKSWQESLQVCPIYHCKGGEYIGLHEAVRAGLKEGVVLDANFQSGFDPITISQVPRVGIPEEQDWTLDESVHKLLSKLVDFLMKTWDSKRFHLVQCSGGADSRILSWLLANLREGMGREWLGDIHFACHHPEGEVFKIAMKRQGWKTSEYSVHKESEPMSGDYFELGDFSRNMNAFTAMGYKWWSDILTPEEEQDAVLINGNYGGELLHYPIKFPKPELNKFDRFVSYFDKYRNTRCKQFLQWGDILMPYLSLNYINTVFSIPNKHFKLVKRLGIEIDLLRKSMLDFLGDITPTVYGHNYDFTLSEKRRAYIRDSWLGSKFFKDFRDEQIVKNARPGTDPRGSVADRLYSLATAYELV